MSGLGDQVTTETRDGTPVLHGHIPRESIWFLVLIDMGTLGMGGVLVGVDSSLLPGLKGQTWVLRFDGRFLYLSTVPSASLYLRLQVCLSVYCLLSLQADCRLRHSPLYHLSPDPNNT